MSGKPSAGYLAGPEVSPANKASLKPFEMSTSADEGANPAPDSLRPHPQVQNDDGDSSNAAKGDVADPLNVESLVRRVLHTVMADPKQSQSLINGKLALNEKEAAALLSLNPWQLRDLRVAGRISHHRIVGDRVRYTHDDLRAYLERGRQPGSG